MSVFRFVYGSTKSGLVIDDLTPPFASDQADSNTLYLCYENNVTDAIFIRKIVTTGTVTYQYKTIGLWNNRASLTYVPVNS